MILPSILIESDGFDAHLFGRDEGFQTFERSGHRPVVKFGN
jgi:hypothetical protein